MTQYLLTPALILIGIEIARRLIRPAPAPVEDPLLFEDAEHLTRYTRKHGEIVQRDDFGALWRVAAKTFEWQNSAKINVLSRCPALNVVEVVNATSEPDGTQARFMIRVPLEIETAHEAVAWTFCMTADEYVETAAS